MLKSSLVFENRHITPLSVAKVKLIELYIKVDGIARCIISILIFCSVKLFICKTELDSSLM